MINMKTQPVSKEWREKLKRIDEKYAIVPSEEHYKTGMASKHWTEMKLDDQMALMESYAEQREVQGAEKLFQAFDAKYKDFELTKALGEVLNEIRTNFKKL